ncbi:MAG: primosomal protein N' [Deltaproteobacteria bacterium]|nr:primosomal protein N' [Deltaproteobacteria bacterium]
MWGTFHYAVPEHLGTEVQAGSRVLVPFGPRGVTGVVVRIHAEAPAHVGAILPLRQVLDESPALDQSLIDLCLWVAEYYEAPPGEVLRAALPAGTGVLALRKVRLTQEGKAALRGEAPHALSLGARKLLAALEDEERRVTGKDAQGLAQLLSLGLAEETWGETEPRVKARMVTTLALARPPTPEEQAMLARSPRRQEVLTILTQRGGPVEARELARTVKGAAPAIKALRQAGLITAAQCARARDPISQPSPSPSPHAPTQEQVDVLAVISGAVRDGSYQSFLLHGVTGSGKTEVYLRAIAEVRGRGRTAIVLVPEIALTPQLAGRFRARFGDDVAVLHSGLSPGERYDQWRRLREGHAGIALGARSAVFAPLANLGMIVVDEEHDSSFKQEEGVRYHARDVALVRAKRASAACILGSATPSLESYQNALIGRHRLLEMRSRATARPLPEVTLIDLRIHRPDAESMLTAPLAQAVDDVLRAGEQAILFLNRRGFATFVVCVGCGHAFRCPHCSVSLTYHRIGERLCCHYCGYAEPIALKCPMCKGTESIRRLGLGTERIEDALARRFPGARIGRLDRDTAAGRGLRAVLDRFAAREVDILVGTQMVTKGHDFPGVTLVGVLLADTGLSLPDFRAAERTFQLLTQVAGRAGRGDRPGRVLVQTFAPENPAIACAQAHDYHAFFAAEAESRRELFYPPEGRLIAIRLDGAEEKDVRGIADELAARAQVLLEKEGTSGISILGPAEAPLKRLRGKTRWHLWAKGHDRVALRCLVRKLLTDLPRSSGVRVSVDIDPMSTL